MNQKLASSEIADIHITHVIFDVDGLLLDSESIYTKIMDTIAAEYGKTFTWNIKSLQMGQKQQEAGRIFIGAAKLVNHLHRHNIPMCLATGSHKKELELKIIRHAKLFSLFSHAVCAGDDPDVAKGKPAPDCFLVASDRFLQPPNPAEVLVFEDAPNGVAAALAAGMRVIWVPDKNCPLHQYSHLIDDPKVKVLQSLSQFIPEKYSLPAFD